MTTTIEAIYENGVLRPVTPIQGVAEHQRLKVTIEDTSSVPIHPALQNCFGILPDDEANRMIRDIDEEFEKVDPNEWK